MPKLIRLIVNWTISPVTWWRAPPGLNLVILGPPTSIFVLIEIVMVGVLVMKLQVNVIVLETGGVLTAKPSARAVMVVNASMLYVIANTQSMVFDVKIQKIVHVKHNNYFFDLLFLLFFVRSIVSGSLCLLVVVGAVKSNSMTCRLIKSSTVIFLSATSSFFFWSY